MKAKRAGQYLSMIFKELRIYYQKFSREKYSTDVKMLEHMQKITCLIMNFKCALRIFGKQ